MILPLEVVRAKVTFRFETWLHTQASELSYVYTWPVPNRSKMGPDPVRKSDLIGLLFSRNRSGTGPVRIQNLVILSLEVVRAKVTFRFETWLHTQASELSYVYTWPVPNRSKMGPDPVRKSDLIGLLFSRDHSVTGPERIQNWSCWFAGPVFFNPFRSVPDRFQTVLCEQKSIRSGSVLNGSGPVPCKRWLTRATQKSKD